MFFLFMTEILLRNYRFWRLDWEAIFKGQSKTRISNQFSRIILARIGSRLKFLIEKTYAFWLIFISSNIKYRNWNLSFKTNFSWVKKSLKAISRLNSFCLLRQVTKNDSIGVLPWLICFHSPGPIKRFSAHFRSNFRWK